MKTKSYILFGLAVVLLFTAAACAMTIKVKTSDGSGIYSTPLIAGQHTDIGDVYVRADNEFLYISYEIDLDNDFYLVNTHLWAGKDLIDLPVNRKGNPALGRFPYVDENLDTKALGVQIPLYSLGLTPEDICDEDKLVYYAAHATVIERIGLLGSETQTAWAEGEEVNPGGSWAMYDEITLTCEEDCLEVEGWGQGRGDLPDSWGWYSILPFMDCPWVASPLLLEDGTFVGTAYYGYNRHRFEAHIFMDKQWELKDANLYFGYDFPPSDPEQFNGDSIMVLTPEQANGNGAVWRSPDYFKGGPLYAAMHVVVCERENNE